LRTKYLTERDTLKRVPSGGDNKQILTDKTILGVRIYVNNPIFLKSKKIEKSEKNKKKKEHSVLSVFLTRHFYQ